jgi:hypothetical protein
MSASPPPYPSIRELIEISPLTEEQIEAIRAAWPGVLIWEKWKRDPDVGLVDSGNTMPGGGHRGSTVTATVEPDGKRLMTRYGDTPARINTYGDSFTHGDQVNDGETWQEYLAAHLREPIRNFGRGGGSVYEAYLRMTCVEATDSRGDHLLLYMWGDDHMRSILGGNMAVNLAGQGPTPDWQAQGFATPYLRIDPDTGEVSEHPAFLRTSDDLVKLGDPAWYLERFEHDLVAQLMLFGGHPRDEVGGGVIDTIDEVRMASLAAALDFEEGWATAADRRAAARELLDRYSLRASIHVIEKARSFAAERGKKIMFLTFDPFRSVRTSIESGFRYDQAIVDHLASTGADAFDMTQVHVDDFRSRRDDWSTYLQRYFVNGAGHYNPAGNHFFAFSLLPTLLEWLDPQPVPYR